ncbi:MAG: thioredoxin domain-containing protein [Acidobacteriaceae bacterium]|nr:thioredoxin domain-containing protein [Acidobacteriaceae bacterium]
MPTNALIDEKSPYLRQHAYNPVNWLPWGERAFEKARREDKPIFLSIGYSTCHWCHVMAHESFEDEPTAEILNREFIPIKVDREERPDVDRIYMLFVQASSGSGGWPMSVWLTPDLKPFFGGTYFPPDSRYGRPGFREVLEHLARAWKQERGRIESSSANVMEQLRAISASAATAIEPDRELFESAFWQFRRSFDPRWGGFGGAPKFPRPVALNYLLRYFSISKNAEALEMVTQTLRAMAAGGMNDHLGGGFHRYSVDERWFVPHFEKMLYDQAQLITSYAEAYQATGEQKFACAARAIVSYLERDLADSEGGFHSAEDADSPDPENPAHSREGAFYVWQQREIEALLEPQHARMFCQRFGVQPSGNVAQDPHGEFTDENILFAATPDEEIAQCHGLPLSAVRESLERSSKILFEARSKRPRPHLDNKVLTAWNALSISALARSGIALREERHLQMAESAARFILTRMYDQSSGQLLRRYSDGEAGIPAFLDDYAFLAQAMVDLFEATGKAQYLETALDLSTRGFQRFEDSEAGAFFSTEPNAPDILLRMKEDYDGAEPSANSVAIEVLIRLNHLTGNDGFRKNADRALAVFAPKLKAQPTMAPQMLVAIGRRLSEPNQTVVRCEHVDSQVERILAEARKAFNPYALVLALSDEAASDLRQASPFLAGLERKGRITIYECQNFVCELPKVI